MGINFIISHSNLNVHPRCTRSSRSRMAERKQNSRSVLASRWFLSDFLWVLCAHCGKVGILPPNVAPRRLRDPRMVAEPVYPSQSQREGTHMTRIPLNRAYEHTVNLREKLQMSCAEIGLAVRTTNCLEERGVFTVDDLLHCKREDLLSISNFGEKTLEEVYKALESIGFYRPGHQPVEVA